MFPAFAHFARTATRDTELHGQSIREGEKLVMWYPSSNRDESRYEDAERFDVKRNPEGRGYPQTRVTPIKADGSSQRYFSRHRVLTRSTTSSALAAA